METTEKTTQKTVEEKAVSITQYFVSLPPLEYFLAAIIFMGIVFGIWLDAGKYQGLDIALKGGYNGLLLLSAPAAICAVLTKLMARNIPFNRIVATTVIAEFIYGLTYAASAMFYSRGQFYGELALLLGAGIVFIIWFVIGRLAFIFKWRAAFFAVIQLFIHLLFLFNSGTIMLESDPTSSILKFYLVALIFFCALYIFFTIINAPMRKTFGISSTDAISMFVGQWLYHNKDMEEALSSVGMKARTMLSFLAFDRGGNDRVFFVVPCVHFGPFGNLGGSEFSHLIAKELDAKYGSRTFVFHGTVTHDLNPVSSNELGAVLGACDACIKEAKYKDTDILFTSGKEAECTADGLHIGDCSFIGLSRAPQTTEDINFGLGLAIMAEAEKNRRLVVAADKHNAEIGEITTFEPGDITGFNYMKAAIDAIKSMDGKTKAGKLSIGISKRHVDLPFIGSAGVKVAIFSSDPEYVLILVDANGIAPEFHDQIVKEVGLLGKQYGKKWNVGIYTTDTHEINIIRGGLNPMKEEGMLLEEIKTGVAEAMLDMKPARFFATKKWFDINVLGAKQSIEIISTVNSIVATAKIIGPIMLLAAIAAIIFILTKI